MTDINKQKFLAELGKLLTFMYEEDRLSALEMYSRMFENAEDEQALIQLLSSPTRQAVIVARAYNGRERKLQVSAQSRGDELAPEEGSSDFLQAIDQIYQAAVARQIIAPEVTEGQFSLFEDDKGLAELYDTPAIPAQEPVLAAPAEQEPAEEAPAPVIDEAAPAVEETAPAEAEAEDAPAAPELTGEVPVAKEPAAVETEKDPAVEEAAAPVEEAEAAPNDKVDAFIAGFAIQGDALAERPEGGDVQAEEAAPEEAPLELNIPEPEPETAAAEEGELVRKPRMFLLILYIILAVPITLVGVALLLIPTVFFLSLGFIVAAAGVAILTAAFSGFAVFADIMVILGTALMVLALGLLFLWIFVWFIGGAIVGFVRAVVQLGGNWCYKEVPAV